MSETTRTRLSLYGRLADELSRELIPGRRFDVRLGSGGASALRKDDGTFAFIDLPLSPVAHTVILEVNPYRRRELQVTLPTLDPVELALPGEDELYVVLTGVDAASKSVFFETPAFLPPIRQGATVRGPGGFSATLDEDIEGSGVQFATLSTVSGLVAGNMLRFERSTSLLLQPGPYYPFAAGTTQVAFEVVENSAGGPPLAGSALEIDRIDGLALTTTVIAGLTLHSVALPALSTPLLLGTERAVKTVANERGHALFYFPQATPITELRIQVARAGYVPATELVPIAAGARVSRAVKLDRL